MKQKGTQEAFFFPMALKHAWNLCWLVVNLTQTRVTREEGISIKELPSLDGPVGVSVGHFLDK